MVASPDFVSPCITVLSIYLSIHARERQRERHYGERRRKYGYAGRDKERCTKKREKKDRIREIKRLQANA